MLIILLLCIMMAMFVIPSEAFSAQVSGTGGTNGVSSSVATPNCSQVKGNQIDLISCLPSGRWGQSVGSITSRIEPSGSGNIIGKLANASALISNVTRTLLPSMLMMITQVCWNSALALSQFAASFDPLTSAGATLDNATAELINNLFEGSIPAAIAVLAIFAWIGAAGFQIGTVKEASKRILIMVLCFSALTILGSGAAKTGKNASEPATGSPWWVVRTINNTINEMTVGLNLDHIISGNSQMMAYQHGSGESTNCQDYVYAMDKQYSDAAKANKRNDESNVVNAVNRLWEETALRSWVTMQYGSPSEGGTTSSRVASNAQQAYCHVIELATNTSPYIQQELTNKAMGLNIQPKAATFLFTKNGWIDPQDTRVNNKEKTQLERDDYTKETRAGVFWETCTTHKYSDIYAREGWGDLINNLGDTGSGEIKNGSQVVRVKLGAVPEFKNVEPSNHDTIMHAAKSGQSGQEATTAVCRVILRKNTDILNRKTNYNPEENAAQNDTNYGDAASIGWRFDVPNVGGTWREANLSDEADDTTAHGATKKTISYMYGNEDVDTLGACGTLIGAICNMLVWGALSIILMLSKLMLLMMVMFLSVAFLVQGFPIGEKPKKVLKNWVTYTCNLSMTGALYGVLGTIATFICQLTLKFTSDMPNSFMHQLIAGLSPILAIAVIGMFCSKVLKWGNPFSINALMGMAGGTAMASGIRSGLSTLGRASMLRSMASGFRRNPGHVGRLSTNGTGAGVAHGGAQQSASILDRMSSAQQAAFDGKTRNLLNRSEDGYKRLADHGRKSVKWAEMDGNTVRGSLAGARLRMEEANDRLHKRWGTAASNWRAQDNIEAFRNRILQRHPGMSLAEAERKAARWNSINNAGRKAQGAARALGATVGMAGSSIAFAARAAGSAPLHDAVANGAGVAFRGAKVAAKAAVTAALVSNPITMPLGLAAASRLATSRETWGTVAAVSNGTLALKKGLKGLGRENGNNPFDDTGDAGAGTVGGSPTPTEVIPGDGGETAPTTQLPITDTSNPIDDTEAFNQVRSGMMSDFIGNQHMTQEEAEQAFQQSVNSGEVAKAVADFGQAKQTQPSASERNPIVNTNTGEVVGETLPTGTMDAAVSAAATWQNATGNSTPMPESVNRGLQSAYMSQHPVQQTSAEHLDMARKNWEATTGLPASSMPAGAERAMNPNDIIPSQYGAPSQTSTQPSQHAPRHAQPPTTGDGHLPPKPPFMK